MRRVFAQCTCLVLFLAVAGCTTSYGQTYQQANVNASMRPPGGQIDALRTSTGTSRPKVSGSKEPIVRLVLDALQRVGAMASLPTRPLGVHRLWLELGLQRTVGLGDLSPRGRWFFDDSYGWVWVPGSEWAPAWVAWRYGDNM